MKKDIRLTKDTMIKDTVLKFNKFKIGLKDVEEIAESIVNKLKRSDKSREAKYNIVKDLMKYKLQDAIKCIKVAKAELNFSKKNLTIVVRKATYVREVFMELVDKELNHIWSEIKEKNREKVNWNIQRHKGKKDNMEGTFKGIIVGDSELEEYEKEIIGTEKNEIENKAVIYAAIKVNKKEEEILSLPPDVFPKVDIEDTDMQKCVIKCTWKANNEQRKAEEKKAMDEASEEVKENEDENIKNLYDTKLKKLKFTNLKPTDFKNN